MEILAMFDEAFDILVAKYPHIDEDEIGELLDIILEDEDFHDADGIVAAFVETVDFLG